MSQEEEGVEENSNNNISLKDQEEQQQQDTQNNDELIENKDGDNNPEGYDKDVHVDDLGDAEQLKVDNQQDNLESQEQEESQIEQTQDNDDIEVQNMIAKMKGETNGKKKHNCGTNKTDDRKSSSLIKEQQESRKSEITQNNPDDADNDSNNLDQHEEDKIKELLTRLIKMEDNFKQLANEWVNDREDVKNELEITNKEQIINGLLEKVSEAAKNGLDSVEDENISLVKEEALAKALLDKGTGERVITQKIKENEEKQVKKQQEQIKQNEELTKRIKELEDTVKSLLEEKNITESNQQGQYTEKNNFNNASTTPNSTKKSLSGSISHKDEFWNPQKELESEEFTHYLPNKPRLNPIQSHVTRAPKIYYQTPQSLTREIYRTAVANRQLFMQSIPEEQQQQPNKRNITPLLGSTDKLNQRTQSGLRTPLTKQFSRSEGRNYIIKNHPADKNIFSNNFTPQSQRISEHNGSNNDTRQYSQSGMIKSNDYSQKKKQQYYDQTDKLHYLIPDNKVEYL